MARFYESDLAKVLIFTVYFQGKVIKLLQTSSRQLVSTAALSAIIILTGCNPTQSEKTNPTTGTGETTAQPAAGDDGKPKVVASYSVSCDMVEEIGADKIDSNCLIDYDQDPHTYEAKPSDRKAIEDADAVFYAGLNSIPLNEIYKYQWVRWALL